MLNANVRSLNQASAPVQGAFAFENILADGYGLVSINMPPGVYMKKILLNGADAPRYGLEFGHSMQDHFQILVGADGGRVSCMVADGKENPVVGASVRLFAADTASEVEFATASLVDTTDQFGQCEFSGVPPGKYRIMASPQVPLEPTALRTLWNKRGSAAEIEVGPGAAVSSTLHVVEIR